jgi:hypothetical protein
MLLDRMTRVPMHRRPRSSVSSHKKSFSRAREKKNGAGETGHDPSEAVVPEKPRPTSKSTRYRDMDEFRSKVTEGILEFWQEQCAPLLGNKSKLGDALNR